MKLIVNVIVKFNKTTNCISEEPEGLDYKYDANL